MGGEAQVTKTASPADAPTGPCSMCGDPAQHRCYVETGEHVYTGVVCSPIHALDWCLGVASTINAKGGR